MPDENKHAALKEAGFQIAKTCSTCVHWVRTSTRWGDCILISYVHRKHEGGARPAGTPAVGTCSKWKASDVEQVALAGEDYAKRYAPGFNGCSICAGGPVTHLGLCEQHQQETGHRIDAEGYCSACRKKVVR